MTLLYFVIVDFCKLDVFSLILQFPDMSNSSYNISALSRQILSVITFVAAADAKKKKENAVDVPKNSIFVSW